MPEMIAKDPERLISAALGRLIASELQGPKPGVTVHWPPPFDPDTFLEVLAEESQASIGVAMAAIGEADVQQLQEDHGSSSLGVTSKVSHAVQWRNGEIPDDDLEDLGVPEKIVLLVREGSSKLGSMHRLRSLPAGRISEAICSIIQERAPFKDNVVAGRLWSLLGSKHQDKFDVRSLALYAQATLTDDPQEALNVLGSELHLLELLPDDGLNSPDVVDERLSKNIKHVDRIADLSKKDRQRIERAITGEEEGGDLAAEVERIRQFDRTGDIEHLKGLSLSKVEDLLKRSATSRTSTSTTRRKRPSEEAALDLLFEGDKEELRRLSSRLEEELENEETLEEEETLELDFGDGEVLGVEIQEDLLTFLQAFVTPETCAALIDGDASLEETIENFRSLDAETLSPHHEGSTVQKLQRFSERSGEFTGLVESLETYLEARAALIDDIPELLHAPILFLMGSGEARERARHFLRAYQDAEEMMDKEYRDLQEVSTTGASKLVAEFLTYDQIAMETDEGLAVFLSPLHPFHLWRSLELANRLLSEVEDLEDADKEFLFDAVDRQPHLLQSLRLPENSPFSGSGHYLIQSEERGNLPVYRSPKEAPAGDNQDLWDFLFDKFIQAYPISSSTLKLCVVDPIEPWRLLKGLAKRVEDREIERCDVRLVYRDVPRRSIFYGCSSAAREHISRVFASDTSFEGCRVRQVDWDDEDIPEGLETDRHHILVWNDKGQVRIEEFQRDTDTAIHPLYVPKEFEYDELEDEILISPSSEGTLFSEYQNLLNQLSGKSQNTRRSDVHEMGIGREMLHRLLNASQWVCVTAPRMHTDPFWSDNLLAKERRGDRDFAVYSDSPDIFKLAIEQEIHQYRVGLESEDLERIRDDIATEPMAGLLSVLDSGTLRGTSPSRKGVLGYLAARRWLETSLGDLQLILSIDNPVTRAWLELGDRDRRADLITLYGDEDGPLQVEVTEVKAHRKESQPFTVEEGKDTTHVKGDAVDQVEKTAAVLRRIFGEDSDEDLTIAPRREAFREQIYYEMVSGEVTQDKRFWVDKVNEVFRGEAPVDIKTRVVSVDLEAEGDGVDEFQATTENARDITVVNIPRKVAASIFRGETDIGSAVSGEDDTDSEEEETAEPTTGDHPSTEDADGETEEVDPETDTELATEEDRPDVEQKVEELKRVLDQFGIQIQRLDPNDVDVGPNVIRYKVKLQPGEKQNRLERRAEDLARQLALPTLPVIRRVPNTQFVGIDVAREDRDVVRFLEKEHELPADPGLGDLPFIAGVNPAGETVVKDLSDGPHMLVAGTTGSGKTVFLYNLLCSFLETHGTEGFDLAIIDPKLTNFMFCEDLPNLVNDHVITDSDEALEIFDDLVNREIEERKEILKNSGSVDIHDHNERNPEDPLRPIVVLVDEYADLLDQAEDEAETLETNVRRIAQIARSVGIHLVIATQRPSADIINTDLRSNLDMRAAFRVPSQSDSRVILDEGGAEGLGGEGDMIFREPSGLLRLQGTLVEPDELRDVVAEYER
jgi:hypothetical protein